MAKPVLTALGMALALAGCATGQGRCLSFPALNCVGSNTQQVCEEKDGCQHCYCAASPGQTLFPNQGH